MIKKNWLFIGILSIALVFSVAMVFTACADSAAAEKEDDDDDDDDDGPQSVTYVAYDSSGNKYTLEITEEGTSQSAQYVPQTGDSFTFTIERRHETEQTYTVLFTSTGGVEVVIDDEGEIIIVITVNEEDLTFTITTTADRVDMAISGDIVDEEGETVIETPKKLDPPDENGEWVDPYPVEKPVITGQSGTKRYMTSMTPTPLNVTVAAISDDGDLTYQWYSSDIFANNGGTELDGEIATTYQPTASGEGTTYYYLVATNTKIYDPEDDGEGGDPEPIVKLATTASAPMGVIMLESLPAVQATVTVTDTQNQYVRGFGGMSNGFEIGSPARYMQMADIETMFNPAHPQYLGLNILRIMIYPKPLEQVLTNQVYPAMNHPSTYIQAVQAVNRYGGYVLASPWTPPENYKTNAAARGHLKETMYPNYANYLRTFASGMASRGAPIYALTIQNEPSLEVGYDGMEWTPAEQRTFLAQVGNRITRAYGSTAAIKGWGAGKETDYVLVAPGEAHNVTSWYENAMDALVNPTSVNVTAAAAAWANVDLVAYHIYGGRGNYNSITRNGKITKETWMTEYNINSGAGLYEQDSTWDFVWLFVDTIDSTIRVNNSSAFVWWYLKRFYCVIGDGSNATVNGAIMPRGHTLGHFALYATDTVRVNATTTHSGAPASVRVSAFQRKSNANKTTDRDHEVMADEDSYSVVIYDQRTSGTTGTTLRVNIPAGFNATRVSGIISDSSGNRRAPVNVILNPDGDSADVTLPMNAIVSLKFVK